MSTSKKQEVMDQVRQELAVANAQELISVSNGTCILITTYLRCKFIQKVNDKCFAKCVLKPGPRLDSTEQVSGKYYQYVYIYLTTVTS
jgi:import inner membrane translocase subunit TIM13